jgi:hypothetical protein
MVEVQTDRHTDSTVTSEAYVLKTIKLSLCLSKHYTVETYGGADV